MRALAPHYEYHKAQSLSGLTELENYLLSAFTHGSTLETTLGGMVCALDEDQVGEFVPALHNISAQYHVDRAHSIWHR